MSLKYCYRIYRNLACWNLRIRYLQKSKDKLYCNFLPVIQWENDNSTIKFKENVLLFVCNGFVYANTSLFH